MKPAIRTTVLLALFAPAVWGAEALPTVKVYKTPTCGCCSNWVDHMKASGFKVVTQDMNDVTPHKQRLGVPPAMGSCHTAEVAGYLIEGHVPAADILRLLREQPEALGLAVPGMPIGSPGMDGPEYKGRRDPYDVLLVLRGGATRVFQHFPGR